MRFYKVRKASRSGALVYGEVDKCISSLLKAAKYPVIHVPGAFASGVENKKTNTIMARPMRSELTPYQTA
jgi:hypothetical protein